MDIDSNENSNWFFNCGLMEDISAVPGGDFSAEAPPPPAACFSWPAQPLNSSSYGSAEADCSFGDSEGQKEGASRKRSKSGSCNASGSKACREKLRRDKLTERFLELGSVLEPERPPKTDKAAILSDAVRIVTQLRSEAQKLRESNEEIQERIKELKAEKNELRIEKQRLKEEKEKVEQQVKAMTAQPGFLPHPSAAMPAGYGAQGQAADNKLMPFISYPGVAMWQFIPPSVRDTSQDHVLRPPVA
ncbi:transcription factor ILR3-like [Rhododendron vialii]|uniref:transcription factor ILR3-like n=1 Tax=Rhododendron vialii TaxID=182163 RepID=UPI00265DCE54|nr:transcription factor ILR3-like [Rhododendron vialii]